MAFEVQMYKTQIQNRFEDIIEIKVNLGILLAKRRSGLGCECDSKLTFVGSWVGCCGWWSRECGWPKP